MPSFLKFLSYQLILKYIKTFVNPLHLGNKLDICQDCMYIALINLAFSHIMSNKVETLWAYKKQIKIKFNFKILFLKFFFDLVFYRQRYANLKQPSSWPNVAQTWNVKHIQISISFPSFIKCLSYKHPWIVKLFCLKEVPVKRAKEKIQLNRINIL